MTNEPTLIGTVQDVRDTTVSVFLSDNILSGLTFVNGCGYRIGQIGTFVRIPIGFVELFGIISQVGANSVPEKLQADQPYGNRWISVQLIGEGAKTGSFQRGISQYPTIGDHVHLVSEHDLGKIYGQPDKGYFAKIGSIAGADSIPALIDVNKLITRHSAIVGTTGSGKSTTVTSLLKVLSNKDKYPSSRILIFDIHGEYAKAFKNNANVFRINSNSQANEKELCIPFWAFNFEELMQVCFGKNIDEKSKHLLMEKIVDVKKANAQKNTFQGANIDALDVDAPIPYKIHELWYDLYGQYFSTYYNTKGADRNSPNDWAYVEDLNGQKQKGDANKGIPPKFKSVDTSQNATVKINYTLLLNSYSGIGAHLESLGAKLRLPRYNFLFNPGSYSPKADGSVDNDLDKLLGDWISSTNPISILDLSGVPSEIMNTVVGAISRILYDALFWGRNYSQGGKQRPLLMVMEEAHNYLGKSDDSNFASLAVQKIVKEGRKYGIGAMIVSQRPSEINSTVLSQCGTFISLRLTNAADRGNISGTIPDNLEGLTNMLSTLRTGEAIILGEAVKLPMRTIIDPPSKEERPDSEDPVVFDPYDSNSSTNVGGWGIPMENDPKFDKILESWRKQSSRVKRN